mmetsp:Transcript_99837/g.321773  ORF Transcript_99837/g.321773 Transcript_99837/m.321773 type:complete len:147 (+) Transcript_99837:640-1080(+)
MPADAAWPAPTSLCVPGRGLSSAVAEAVAPSDGAAPPPWLSSGGLGGTRLEGAKREADSEASTNFRIGSCIALTLGRRPAGASGDDEEADAAPAVGKLGPECAAPSTRTAGTAEGAEAADGAAAAAAAAAEGAVATTSGCTEIAPG